ncbi:hypothetical protein N9M16_03355 [Candidatus Dependentiae bacterium]|nr:hypothetical protein [Candidatus Dependentiae bacterium]
MDSTTSVFHFFLSWCASYRSIRTRDTHSTRAPILNIPTDTFAYFVSDMFSVRYSRAIYAALVALLAFGACFAHATAAATSDTPTPRRSLQQAVAASRDAAVADATVTTEPTVADVSRHSHSYSSGCSSASIQKTGFVDLQTCSSRDECCPGYTCSSDKVYAKVDFYAPSGRRRSLLQEDLGRGYRDSYNSAVQTTHVETGYVAEIGRYSSPVCCLGGPVVEDLIASGSFDYAQATKLICNVPLDTKFGLSGCPRASTIADLQENPIQDAVNELACLCCTGFATLRVSQGNLISFWCNTKESSGPTSNPTARYLNGECARYV